MIQHTLPPEGQPGSIAIGDVITEAGATINDVTVAFERWGRPNADFSNVVLLEHALTGDAHASGPVDTEHPTPGWWNGMIGSGRALDTDRFCIICTNVIGGCRGTTGPASLHPDGAAWGSRFPAVSVRDAVNVEYMALKELGIHQLVAVVGGSLGGARALEWSLMHPDVVGRALVLAAGARASAWQIGIQSAQIQFIETDPHWYGGDYYSTGEAPVRGLGFARRVAHLTYRGELELDDRFGASAQAGENPLGPSRGEGRFQVESYLDHQADKLAARFDAGSYVVLTDMLNRYDIGRGRGGMNDALAYSTVPTMVAGVDTDILYPLHQQRHLARNLGNCLGLRTICSPTGHDGFLTEFDQVEAIIREFFQVC
ncbi:homoserine O-acetyltransferase [Corynebacterium sp. TAE3-ERU12]|uniref:homoserine O-acetyltransferase MetX n=1 Tax=Corynebacterium sp. TAE3-ERU12 TaxID=2849491 RepID=UPI001C459F9F|nr:homoserine O-acetyltransferase [Corynebacterium sp. TAE3-ERU12]MBV7294748.1 homoserine O-acetyltransferase [Corynebacterium sp. TAE3-ERU12]